MPLRLDTFLLVKLSDGVILLDRQAQVLGHNGAGEPRVPRCYAMLGALKVLINEEVHGRVALPIRINLWASIKTGEQPAVAWLVQNGHRGYAVLVPAQQRTAPPPKSRKFPFSLKSVIANKADVNDEYKY